MRTVTLNPPLGAGLAAVIFDENKSRPADACPGGFRPKPARQFQNTPLFRGSAPFIADRFNMYSIWDFTASHFFASQMQTQDFIGNRAAIARAGELMIQTSTAAGSFVRYYKSAFLTTCECVKEFQLSCDYHYILWLPSLYSITP